MELNKLVGAVFTAGLVFMAINVGVDEMLHKSALEMTAYPVSTLVNSPVNELPECMEPVGEAL